MTWPFGRFVRSMNSRRGTRLRMIDLARSRPHEVMRAHAAAKVRVRTFANAVATEYERTRVSG